jgi:CheY-like chemotaxis protein
MRLVTSERILVVDDDPIQLKLTRVLLSAKGYYVETAEAGSDALALAKAMRPTLVITDFQLPDLTGIELTKAIRSDPETAEIPVVLLTAMTESEVAGEVSGLFPSLYEHRSLPNKLPVFCSKPRPQPFFGSSRRWCSLLMMILPSAGSWNGFWRRMALNQSPPRTASTVSRKPVNRVRPLS